MNIDLRGKTALVTGADHGLGAAIARHFASLGCDLALLGKNDEKLKQVSTECEQRGLQPAQIIMLTTDLQQEVEVTAAFGKIVDKFGKLNILVNCSGTLAYGHLADTEPSSIQESFDEHVITMVTVTKAAIPYLEKTQGVIINISSSSARRTSPGLLAFSMSKAAINYFTETVALDLAPKKIRVNAVSPSVSVFESLFDASTVTPFKEVRSPPLEQTPDIDDVAQAVAFLASDESLFITGENLPIDGGLHIAGLPF